MNQPAEDEDDVAQDKELGGGERENARDFEGVVDEENLTIPLVE